MGIQREHDSVSVIVSVYDSYDRYNVLIATLKRWQTQDICPEVILSEQVATKPAFESISRDLGIKHVVSLPDQTLESIRYNIGRVRNAGILASTGKILYMTDADVLPLRRDYLKRLCSTFRPHRVLFRPKMFRLDQEASSTFIAHLERHNDIDWNTKEDFCLSDFDKSHLSLLYQAEVAEYYDGWRYVCTPLEYDQLQSAERGRTTDINLIMRPDVHWGGTLLSREAALMVGGYAELYYGWGFEDDDFHAKLAYEHSLVPIFQREVIHFEHPRPYNNICFRMNEAVYTRRIASGVAEMIKQDLNNPTSLFTAWSRRI